MYVRTIYETSTKASGKLDLAHVLTLLEFTHRASSLKCLKGGKMTWLLMMMMILDNSQHI